MNATLRAIAVRALRPVREPLVSLLYRRAAATTGGARAVWLARAVHWRAALYGRGRPIRRLARTPFDFAVWVNIRERVGADLYFGLPYEPFEMAVFARLARPGAVVIDVGANLGLYALRAASLVGPRGLVHAFEPASATYALLRANLAHNAAANVRAFQVALSDAPGEGLLQANRESALAGLAATGRGQTVAAERVRIDTLDAHVAREGLGHVDLLKVDVEGFEGHVLRGARATLERERDLAILCELEGKNFGALGFSIIDVVRWVGSLGYDVWGIDRSAGTPRRLAGHDTSPYQNFVFVRPGSGAERALGVDS